MASERSPVKIAAVGDIFPGDHYFSMGHGVMSRTQRGGYDPFGEIATALKASDIAIGNLEGPLSSTSTQKSPVGVTTFRGSPAFSTLLRNAGFTHVNVANNHIMQHGVAAFAATVTSLRAAGITPVGLAGTGPGQISAPVIETHHGKTVCLVGYSQVPERYASDPCYAHFTDPRPVADEIARLSDQYDYLIVSCHAGEEGTRIPAPDVVSMYDNFVAAGATCVLGHHSHVFQPVAKPSGHLIAYSLGNFIFDLFWDENTVKSGILEIDIDVDTRRVNHTIRPTYFTRDYRAVFSSSQSGEDFLRQLETTSKQMLVSEEHYQSLLDAQERQNQRRKYLYFLGHIGQGRTLRKLEFLARKCTGTL